MKNYLLGKSGLRFSELALGAIVLLGASKLAQLEDNLGALNADLSPDQIKRLDEISRVEMDFPHAILANPMINQTIAGGVEVHRR
jgi:hypothetical protein